MYIYIYIRDLRGSLGGFGLFGSAPALVVAVPAVAARTAQTNANVVSLFTSKNQLQVFACFSCPYLFMVRRVGHHHVCPLLQPGRGPHEPLPRSACNVTGCACARSMMQCVFIQSYLDACLMHLCTGRARLRGPRPQNVINAVQYMQLLNDALYLCKAMTR